MELSTERAFKKCKDDYHGQQKQIKELQEAVVSITGLVQKLLDEKTGLEEVFRGKIEKMVEDNLEISISYEKDTELLKQFLENEGAANV